MASRACIIERFSQRTVERWSAKQFAQIVHHQMRANSGDPVEAGLVDSIARPGGNLTGTTFFFAEICAKRVELIREAMPAMTRLAVLVNPANASNGIALSAMQRTARTLQVELVPLEVRVRDDIAAATETVAARQASALVVIEDPVMISSEDFRVNEIRPISEPCGEQLPITRAAPPFASPPVVSLGRQVDEAESVP